MVRDEFTRLCIDVEKVRYIIASQCEIGTISRDSFNTLVKNNCIQAM